MKAFSLALDHFDPAPHKKKFQVKVRQDRPRATLPPFFSSEAQFSSSREILQNIPSARMFVTVWLASRERHKGKSAF